MATTTVHMPTTDLVWIDCGRCAGTGQYFNHGTCYSCGGRKGKRVSRRWLNQQAATEVNHQRRHHAQLADRGAELDRRRALALEALPDLADAATAEANSPLFAYLDERDLPATTALDHSLCDDIRWGHGDQDGVAYVAATWTRYRDQAANPQILR